MDSIVAQPIPFHRIRQPLVGIVLVYALGLGVQYHLGSSRNVLLILSLFVILIALIAGVRFNSSAFWILPIAWVAGLVMMSARMKEIQPGDTTEAGIPWGRLPQHAVVRGAICSDPVHRKSSQRERVEFELQVQELNVRNRWEKMDGKILVRRDLVMGDPLQYGQKIECEGVLQLPREVDNYGSFDYGSYLKLRGDRCLLDSGAQDQCLIMEPAGWMGTFFRARKECARLLCLGIEEDHDATSIIRGMLLGYREDIPDSIKDDFRRTGTLHIFAISGTHITLIALSWILLLRMMRLPRRWICLLVIPILVIYVFTTGLRSSSIRALVMGVVILIGVVVGRPSALLNNLALSAWGILIWDPMQLMDAGFQLSFMVVISLILLAPRLEAKFQAFLQPDPYLPRSLLPRWRRKCATPLRWICSMVAVTLAAWIGSLGLTIHYFHLISFTGLLANLLIIPMASLSVGAGLSSLLLGKLWLGFSLAMNTTHALLIHAMIQMTAWMSSWEVGTFQVAEINAGILISAYALLIGSFILLEIGRKGWSMVFFVLLMASGITWGYWKWNEPLVRLDVLSVGDGQCILISEPHREFTLIDTASARDYRWTLKPLLEYRGVQRLKRVILTHGDTSHYGGASSLLEDYPVDEWVIADTPFSSSNYQKLLQELNTAQAQVTSWKRGDEWRDSWGSWEVFWPPEKSRFRQSDEGCLLLGRKIFDYQIIFASDLPHEVSETLPADDFWIGSTRQAIPVQDGQNGSARKVTLFSRRESHDAEARGESGLVQECVTGRDGGLVLELQPGEWKLESKRTRLHLHGMTSSTNL